MRMNAFDLYGKEWCLDLPANCSGAMICCPGLKALPVDYRALVHQVVCVKLSDEFPQDLAIPSDTSA